MPELSSGGRPGEGGVERRGPEDGEDPAGVLALLPREEAAVSCSVARTLLPELVLARLDPELELPLAIP